MAMFTNQLIPPPKSVSRSTNLNELRVMLTLMSVLETSTDLGEARSGQRGGVSLALLDEMNGLGGLKDK
jgi:hypothetical protein